MTELIGHTISHYQIVEEIGRGGMATVYRARQTNIKRDVAIKILPAAFTHDVTFTERFNREVRFIAQMQHARILPVYDYGDFQHQPYIVMAYMPGGTLADLVRQEPLDLRTTVHHIRQIAEGLDSLHQRDVIHRDFKPSNVLLDSTRQNLFLADFGIARFGQATVATLTGEGLVGTPAYMAPEMYERGQVTPSIDIYALGVTLFQMLTTRRPYEYDSPVKLMHAHLYEDTPDVRAYRPDLPSSIQRVIQTALVKDPAQRYPTAGDLASALENAAGDPDGTPYHLDLIDLPQTPRMAPVGADALTSDVGPEILSARAAMKGGRRKRSRLPILLLGGGALLLVAFIAILIGFISLNTGDRTAGNSSSPSNVDVPENDPETTPIQNATSEPTPTAEVTTDEPEPTPAEVLPVAREGGGTGILGLSAAGQRYTVDIDCIMNDREGCSSAPVVLAPVGSGTAAGFGIWSPAGDRVAVTMQQGTSQNRVYLASPSGGDPLLIGDLTARDPAWSPDGSHLAFVSDSEGEAFNLWLADIACLEGAGSDCLTRLTNGAGNESSPVWSPDGTHIAYLQRQPSTFDLAFAVSADGGAPESLTPVGRNASSVEWLPDSTRWVYVDTFRTTGGEAGTLFFDIGLALGAPGQDQSRLVTFSKGDFGTVCVGGVCPGGGEFNLSPDGKFAAIVYAATAREDMELYLLDLACIEGGDTTCQDALQKVTDNAFDDRLPVWSPDGTLLAFIRARNTNTSSAALDDAARNAGSDLFLLDVTAWLAGQTDQALQQITSLGFVDFTRPDWQPAPPN